MKNKRLLGCIILISSLSTLSISEEFTLEQLIENLKINSFSKKNYDINNKKLNIQYNLNERYDKNGLNVKSTAEIYSNGNFNTGSTSMTTEVEYDIFRYKNIQDFDSGNDRNIIGIFKDIKGIFLKPKEYNREILNYTKNYTNIKDLQEINKDILSLIDLYRLYLDTKIEKKLMKKQ